MSGSDQGQFSSFVDQGMVPQGQQGQRGQQEQQAQTEQQQQQQHEQHEQQQHQPHHHQHHQPQQHQPQQPQQPQPQPHHVAEFSHIPPGGGHPAAHRHAHPPSHPLLQHQQQQHHPQPHMEMHQPGFPPMQGMDPSRSEALHVPQQITSSSSSGSMPASQAPLLPMPPLLPQQTFHAQPPAHQHASHHHHHHHQHPQQMHPMYHNQPVTEGAMFAHNGSQPTTTVADQGPPRPAAAVTAPSSSSSTAAAAAAAAAAVSSTGVTATTDVAASTGRPAPVPILSAPGSHYPAQPLIQQPHDAQAPPRHPAFEPHPLSSASQDPYAFATQQHSDKQHQQQEQEQEQQEKDQARHNQAVSAAREPAQQQPPNNQQMDKPQQELQQQGRPESDESLRAAQQQQQQQQQTVPSASTHVAPRGEAAGTADEQGRAAAGNEQHTPQGQGQGPADNLHSTAILLPPASAQPSHHQQDQQPSQQQGQGHASAAPDAGGTEASSTAQGAVPAASATTNAASSPSRPKTYLMVNSVSAKVLDVLLRISTVRGHGAFVLGIMAQKAPRTPRFPYAKILNLIQAPHMNTTRLHSRYFFQSSLHREGNLVQYDSNGVTPLLELRRIMLKGHGEPDPTIQDTLADVALLHPNSKPLLRPNGTSITCEDVFAPITDSVVRVDDEQWWSDVTTALGITVPLNREEIINYATNMSMHELPMDPNMPMDRFLDVSQGANDPAAAAAMHSSTSSALLTFPSSSSAAAAATHDATGTSTTTAAAGNGAGGSGGNGAGGEGADATVYAKALPGQAEAIAAETQPATTTTTTTTSNSSNGGGAGSLGLLADTALQPPNSEFLPSESEVSLTRYKIPTLRVPPRRGQCLHVCAAVAVAIHHDKCGDDQEAKDADRSIQGSQQQQEEEEETKKKEGEEEEQGQGQGQGQEEGGSARDQAAKEQQTAGEGPSSSTRVRMPQPEKADNPFRPPAGQRDLKQSGAHFKAFSASAETDLFPACARLLSMPSVSGPPARTFSRGLDRLFSSAQFRAMLQDPNLFALDSAPDATCNMAATSTAATPATAQLGGPPADMHAPRTGGGLHTFAGMMTPSLSLGGVGMTPGPSGAMDMAEASAATPGGGPTVPAVPMPGQRGGMVGMTAAGVQSHTASPAAATPQTPGAMARKVQPTKQRVDSHWPEEWLNMKVVEFNRFIKNKKLTPEEIDDLKRARRRKKNRLYAKRSRQRRNKKLEETISKFHELQRTLQPGSEGQQQQQQQQQHDVHDQQQEHQRQQQRDDQQPHGMQHEHHQDDGEQPTKVAKTD